MGAFYQSGALAVESGLLEKTVSGLSFPCAPASVSVSLRLPNADADIITAFLIGTPTEDGFTVGFSVPTGEGYVLDWIAVNSETAAVVPAAESNAVTYTDLFNAVRRFLGYCEVLTDAQKSEVDDCVQGGVRQFYFPPAQDGIDGTYRWSFLRFGGSIQLTKGVSQYHLPDGFGLLDGVLTYDAAERVPSVNRVAEEVVRSRLANQPLEAPPRICAVVYRNDFGSRGLGMNIVFWPTPDKDYALNYVADADTGKIDENTRPYPLGGVAFSECILESCLAKAEQLSNDEAGEHTRLFQSHLAAAISRDRQNSASVYGQMSSSQDPGLMGLFAHRNVVHGLRITYNGQEL